MLHKPTRPGVGTELGWTEAGVLTDEWPGVQGVVLNEAMLGVTGGFKV